MISGSSFLSFPPRTAPPFMFSINLLNVNRILKRTTNRNLYNTKRMPADLTQRTFFYIFQHLFSFLGSVLLGYSWLLLRIHLPLFHVSDLIQHPFHVLFSPFHSHTLPPPNRSLLSFSSPFSSSSPKMACRVILPSSPCSLFRSSAEFSGGLGLTFVSTSAGSSRSWAIETHPTQRHRTTTVYTLIPIYYLDPTEGWVTNVPPVFVIIVFHES